jgi:heptosyltransferase-2
MVRKIGVEVESINPEIYLTGNEKNRIQDFRKHNLKGNQKLIGINISSGNSAPNLNESEYKKLIFLLKQNPDYKIAVMDNNVLPEIDNIENVLYPNKGNTLRDSIVNLASLDLLISNSTGPMHICAALSVPTVSLFCPLTACSPKLWGPLGNKAEIIMPAQIYCDTKCPIDPKKCDYSKEGGITAEEVAFKVDKFLNNM